MAIVSSRPASVYCGTPTDSVAAEYYAVINRAWELGYAEGRAGRQASHPATFGPARSEAYTDGWRAGDAGRILDLADRLAWLADSFDNVAADYPGPGWDDDMAALHGDDHDGQFCPLDLEYWTLPNFEYYDAERERDEDFDEAVANWSLQRRVVVGAEGGAL